MSSNSVATVDQDGLVTAVSDGSCTITARSNMDDSLQASIDITVDTSVESYTKIYLSDDYGSTNHWKYNEFKPGTTLILRKFKNGSNYGSNYNIEYSVDNNDVAIISVDGTLNFIDQGVVTVTITDKDDARFNEKYKYKVSNDVPIKGLEVASSTGIATIKKDKGQLQMITREVPSGQVYRDVTYSVDDDSIAYIDDDGLLNAIEDGTVIVTAASKIEPSLKDYVAIKIINQTY